MGDYTLLKLSMSGVSLAYYLYTKGHNSRLDPNSKPLQKTK